MSDEIKSWMRHKPESEPRDWLGFLMIVAGCLFALLFVIKFAQH